MLRSVRFFVGVVNIEDVVADFFDIVGIIDRHVDFLNPPVGAYFIFLDRIRVAPGVPVTEVLAFNLKEPVIDTIFIDIEGDGIGAVFRIVCDPLLGDGQGRGGRRNGVGVFRYFWLGFFGIRLFRVRLIGIFRNLRIITMGSFQSLFTTNS